jgi:hypothetical protein
MSTASATQPTASGVEVDARVDELFAEHGFARTNVDGDIVRDKKKVIKRITEMLISDAVAADNDERLARALSKSEIYERTFRNGPKLNDPDDLEREAAEYVAVYVWSLTTASSEGRVQRHLGEIEGATDLLLCRRRIGDEPRVYLTRSHNLIKDDYIVPGNEKLVKVAQKTHRDMALVIERQPLLEGEVMAELESTATKTAVALGVTPQRALESSRRS